MFGPLANRTGLSVRRRAGEVSKLFTEGHMSLDMFILADARHSVQTDVEVERVVPIDHICSIRATSGAISFAFGKGSTS